MIKNHLAISRAIRNLVVSAYEIVNQASKSLENELKKYTGDLKGAALHNYITLIEHGISPEYKKKLRRLASIRNQLMHDENFELDHEGVEDYKKTTEESLEYLASSSHNLESAFTIVMKACKKIEARLKNDMGAEGKGLIEYANSLSGELPESIFDDLQHVGRVRNDLMHKEGSCMTARNLEEFRMAAEELFRYFDQANENKKRDEDERQRLEQESIERRKKEALERKEAQENFKKSRVAAGVWALLLSIVPISSVYYGDKNLLGALIIAFCFLRSTRILMFTTVFLLVNASLIFLVTGFSEGLVSIFDRKLTINLTLLATFCVAARLVYAKWAHLHEREKLEDAWAGLFPVLHISGLFYLVSFLNSFTQGYMVWLSIFFIIITTLCFTGRLLLIGKYRYNLAFPFIIMSAEWPLSESALPTGLFIGCGIFSLFCIFGDKSKDDDKNIPVLDVSESN